MRQILYRPLTSSSSEGTVQVFFKLLRLVYFFYKLSFMATIINHFGFPHKENIKAPLYARQKGIKSPFAFRKFGVLSIHVLYCIQYRLRWSASMFSFWGTVVEKGMHHKTS